MVFLCKYHNDYDSNLRYRNVQFCNIDTIKCSIIDWLGLGEIFVCLGNKSVADTETMTRDNLEHLSDILRICVEKLIEVDWCVESWPFITTGQYDCARRGSLLYIMESTSFAIVLCWPRIFVLYIALLPLFKTFAFLCFPLGTWHQIKFTTSFET